MKKVLAVLILAVSLGFAALGGAASVNFSQLPTASAPDGSELVPVDQAGATKQITITQIWKAVPGVKGDGITDDSGAINNYIASLPATGGDVFLPAGKYLVKSTININKHIHFYGVVGYTPYGGDPATEIIKDASLNGPAILVSASGCILERFYIKGNAGNGGDGIVDAGTNADEPTIRNVMVYLMGRDGVRIGQDSSGGNENNWRLDTVISQQNGRYGFNFDDNNSSCLNPANDNAGTATNIKTELNGSDGAFINSSGSDTFIGMTAEQNTGKGLHLGACAQWDAFYGGDLNESNTGGNVVLDASYNSTFGANGFYGVDIGTSWTDNAQSTTRIDNRYVQLNAISNSISISTGQGKLITLDSASISIDGPIYFNGINGTKSTLPSLIARNGTPGTGYVTGTIYSRLDGTAGNTLYLMENGVWHSAVTSGSTAQSIQTVSGLTTLMGDSASPGNNYFYGTNGSGTKGWYGWNSVSLTLAQTPLTTLGDILFVNSTPALARLAGNTTATKEYLCQTGTGTVSAAPGWCSISAADTTNGATGSGPIVLATSPTLVTPTLGVATATSINKVTFTAPATSATLTIADGKTLTVNNSLTFAGTDSTTVTFPSTGMTILTGSASLTYTAIGAQSCQEQTISITNASATNYGASCSPNATLGNTNLSWSSWVSSAGTVSVRVCNPSSGSITPSAVTWGCTVSQ